MRLSRKFSSISRNSNLVKILNAGLFGLPVNAHRLIQHGYRGGNKRPIVAARRE
jgi:hypothetical protein